MANEGLRFSLRDLLAVVAVVCVVCGLVAAVLVVSGPKEDTGPKAEEMYSFGQYYEAKEDLLTAIACYTEALRLEPTQGKSFLQRGVCYGQLGQNAEAQRDFSDAIRLNPDSLEQAQGYDVTIAFLQRGVLAGKSGRWRQAVVDFTEAMRINPERNLYNNRGFAYLKLGQHDRALADFTEVLKRNENSIEALANRGETYLLIGRLDEANADFQKALELKPDYAVAHNHLGRLHHLVAVRQIQSRQFEEALANLEKARLSFQNSIMSPQSSTQARQNLTEVVAMIGRLNEQLGQKPSAGDASSDDLSLDPPDGDSTTEP